MTGNRELTRLKKWHEFHTYLNAGHAFQNFITERYRERAARASWHEMLAFFTEHLKRGVQEIELVDAADRPAGP